MTARPQTVAVRLLSGSKEPARVAATGNVTLSGLQVIDGVQTVAGDRIVVPAQTAAKENGLYLASAGAWRRAPDASSDRLLLAGMTVRVQEGATKAGVVYTLLTDRPNIEQDDIEWEEGFTQEQALDVVETVIPLLTRAAAATFSPAATPDAIRIGGHSALGEAPPALFKNVASEPAHDAKVSISLIGGATAWYEFADEALYPEHLGATGTSDDGPTLQKHAAVGAAGGARKLALIAGKTYLTLRGINYPATVPFEGNGATISAEAATDYTLFPTMADAGERAVVRFRGATALTAIPALNANVSGAARFLTFASAHGLAAGDVVFLHNPTTSSYSDWRTYYTAGEACRVARVVSSTQIEIERALYAGYTAVSVNCYKLTAKAASVRDLYAIAPNAGNNSLNTVDAIDFVFWNGGHVENVRGRCEDGEIGICFDRCVGVKIDTIAGYCIRKTGSRGGAGAQYGVAFFNCQDFHGVNCVGIGDRHGFTTGGGTRPGGIVNRNLHFRGSFTGLYDPAADWHGNAEFCSYDGDFYGGLNIGGHGHKATGRIFMDGYGGSGRFAVNFGEPTSPEHDLKLEIFQSDDPYVVSTNNYVIMGDNFGATDGSGGGVGTEKMKYSGTLTLDLTFNCPAAKHLIKIGSKNSSRANKYINLKRIRLSHAPAAGGDYYLRCYDYGGSTTQVWTGVILGEVDYRIWNTASVNVLIDAAIGRWGNAPAWQTSFTYDVPSIADGGVHQWVQAVTGVGPGDHVTVEPVGDILGLIVGKPVAQTNQVLMALYNRQGVARDPASMAWNVLVRKAV
jgi:hypothetical protein